MTVRGHKVGPEPRWYRHIVRLSLGLAWSGAAFLLIGYPFAFVVVDPDSTELPSWATWGGKAAVCMILVGLISLAFAQCCVLRWRRSGRGAHH